MNLAQPFDPRFAAGSVWTHPRTGRTRTVCFVDDGPDRQFCLVEGDQVSHDDGQGGFKIWYSKAELVAFFKGWEYVGHVREGAA